MSIEYSVERISYGSIYGSELIYVGRAHRPLWLRFAQLFR